MPQRDLLFPWLSAIDNAALAPRNRGESKRASREEALPLFARFGLAEFADAMPNELSGGMRQRVAFLRTLLAGKPVLLLDEPFAALDAITRGEMQEWLAGALLAEPRTVLLVTHDVEEALYLCDRVAVLSARPARIVAELRPEAPRSLDRAGAVTDPGFSVASRGGAARAQGALAMKKVLLPLAVVVASSGHLGGARADRRPGRPPGDPRVGLRRDRSRADRRRQSLWDDRELLVDNGWITLQEMLGGLAIAFVLGAGFAIALHLSETLRRAFYPILVASQTIPIVAIARRAGHLARLRDRPEAVRRRAHLLLPDHGRHARRPALGRPAGRAHDAHARRQPRRRSCAASSCPTRCRSSSRAPRSPLRSRRSAPCSASSSAPTAASAT